MRALRSFGPLLAAASLLVGGCARGPVVAASYEVPATVPLRSFPRVMVTSGHDQLEITMAQELVGHLHPDVQVRRVDRDRLEQMRLAGEIPNATLVVLIELRTEEGIDVQTTSRQETVCGPNGCFRRTRYDNYDVPTLKATTTLTVYEGPTARVLQRATLEAKERGRTYDAMRARILEHFLADLKRLVDARAERVEVRLLPVDLPGVAEALERIELGKWREGRLGLERAARSEAAKALERGERARLLYDLGVARRFDPESASRDPAAHFDAAEEALREAIELDPRPRYADALAQLRDHRRAQLEMQRQREATERNFALEAQRDPGSDAVPPPPPGYDVSPPP